MMKSSYTKWVVGDKIILVLLVLLPLLAVNVFAQYGKVQGKVIDAETKEPLNSVNVVLKGEHFNSGAVTDLEGYYNILGIPPGTAVTNLDGYYNILGILPGTYEVKFLYVGYRTIEVSGVEVWSDLTTRLDEMMNPSVGDLPACRIEWERPNIVIPEEVVQEEVYDPEPVMVSSDELEQTIITANMETPIMPGKNVIYCSTFQIAWNMMQDSIIKEDILLEGNPEIARMLNKQLSTSADISEDCYVAMVDFLTQEFLDQINLVLKEKFGDQAPPEVVEDIHPGLPTFFAYAYLYKNLKFEHDFEVIPNPIYFKTTDDTIKLKAFGVPSRGERDTIRNQVTVVDYKDNNDFILKLLSKSPDDEIILAKISPKETLLETIQWVQERISLGTLGNVKNNEPVQIPKCDFNVKHSFDEFPGKLVENSGWEGWFVSKAVQWTRFRLNEKGIVLKSEARLGMRSSRSYPVTKKPRLFVFDKPFLICLRQKDGRYPYFAMWVDNGELLMGWEESE